MERTDERCWWCDRMLLATADPAIRLHLLIMMSCVLETTRLQLRPCQIEDIQLVHMLWTNDRVRYFLFDNRVISSDETRSFIEESLANFEQHGYGLWLVFVRGIEHLVGFAGFLRSEEGTPSLIYEFILIAGETATQRKQLAQC